MCPWRWAALSWDPTYHCAFEREDTREEELMWMRLRYNQRIRRYGTDVARALLLFDLGCTVNLAREWEVDSP